MHKKVHAELKEKAEKEDNKEEKEELESQLKLFRTNFFQGNNEEKPNKTSNRKL